METQLLARGCGDILRIFAVNKRHVISIAITQKSTKTCDYVAANLINLHDKTEPGNASISSCQFSLMDHVVKERPNVESEFSEKFYFSFRQIAF